MFVYLIITLCLKWCMMIDVCVCDSMYTSHTRYLSCTFFTAVVRPRISRDVYSRLQALEARVMHLEERGILYVDDSSSSSSSDDDRGSMEGEGMDDHELDERIRMLEESLRRRQTEMKKKKGGGAPC